MKKPGIYFLNCLVLLLGISFAKTIDAQTNLALTAKVTTSYVSSWEKLEAVNDDYQPANSQDKGPGAYGNWRGATNYNQWDWVEYTFDRENQVDSIRVYWWTDNGGIQIPYEANIEYGGCGGELTKVDNIGIEANKYNTLVVDKKAYRIRVNMISSAATGILEYQVFGSYGPETGLIAYVQINNGNTQQVSQTTINIQVGDTITLSNGLLNLEGGSWEWNGPKGYTSTDSAITIENIQLIQFGKYLAKYTSPCNITFEKSFVLTGDFADNGSYIWPGYNPPLNYDFRQEYPVLEMPTENSLDCNSNVVGGYINDRWFTFVYGKYRRQDVTDTAVKIMLNKFNVDFAYIRDTMGWPPDKRIKDGYRSAIYLYGSGLCTDDADTTAEGGWMGYVNGYPMVLASFYPVRAFDPEYNASDKSYQTEAMIHEEIHAVLADMPGAKESAWFQEGGNTWLQQEMSARRTGDYSSMGYLNGAAMVAPFMPIECYSGWLQDNSFGGPSAEGVNMYNANGTQINTWRNFLGGTQYGNMFPTMLSTVLGKGCVPWIWRYCPGRVLEGMGDTLGDLQIRRLITEYRAKQALVDLDKWTGASRSLLDTYINTKIQTEGTLNWVTPEVWYATPYARTTLDTKTQTLTPEYRTTPGWSGANQIPLKVKGDSVYVNFKPIGKNLTCLIAYRDILGNAIYSEPVSSGPCSMLLKSVPANDVVLVVITNTDYVFKGEETRKAHFDYRLQIDTNLVVPANTQKRWYAWDQNPDSDITPELNPISSPDTLAPIGLSMALETVYESTGKNVKVGTLTTEDPNTIKAQTYSLVSGEGDDDNSYFKITDDGLKTRKVLEDFATKSSYTVRIRSTNLAGKTIEKSFVIPVTVGINNMVADNSNLLVYPNPTNNSATVKLASGAVIKRIEIIGLTGSVYNVYNQINSVEYTMNKANLASGIYYLKVFADRIYIAKLLIQ